MFENLKLDVLLRVNFPLCLWRFSLAQNALSGLNLNVCSILLTLKIEPELGSSLSQKLY